MVTVLYSEGDRDLYGADYEEWRVIQTGPPADWRIELFDIKTVGNSGDCSPQTVSWPLEEGKKQLPAVARERLDQLLRAFQTTGGDQ
jgi:hypothetical protein